ncbi:MAG: DUF2065 domain-containing protein [Legionellales bacterium]|nr:DUF2065 domain-containing protein [Legionellales bacterium]|tara:strand:- start:130 stop:330 length:201 start_codon:yes stop_codon:yes gene_type:complete
MRWQDLIIAVGLLFVFEGIFPFLSPEKWRNFVRQVAIQNDKNLRIMGLIFMILGVVIITLMHLTIK